MERKELSMLVRLAAAVTVAGFAWLALAEPAQAASTLDRPQATIPASWMTPLSLDGTPHEGVIGTGDDADYFRIEAGELTEAVIYTTGGLDSVGVLLDSEGREVASNDDGGDASNFRIEALLRAGAYYVRVASFGFDGATGSYTLRAEGTALAPTTLALGGTSHEGVTRTGDADYFRIVAGEPTEATIHTNGRFSPAALLLDSDGRELASNDDGSEVRIGAVLWPGEYYVRVTQSGWESGGEDSNDGSYTLRAEGTPLVPTTLSLDGTPHEGAIGTEDADYFRIQVTEETGVHIYTTGSLDTVGALFDSEGREVTSDDDGGEGLFNFSIISVLRAGEYYVRVTQSFAFGATDSYTLRAEGTPVSPAPLSMDGTPRAGFTEAQNDTNIFRIEVEQLTEAVIYTTGGLDTAGMLVSPTGHILAIDDDGGENANFRLAELLWPGVYYVAVGSFSGGSYTLHTEGTELGASPILLGGLPREGAIVTPGAADYFRIEVTEPTSALIYTTGGLDTAALLLDPDGREVASNDDGGEGFVNFRIAAILFRPGLYIVEVFSSSGLTGSYTLHTEGSPGNTH